MAELLRVIPNLAHRVGLVDEHAVAEDVEGTVGEGQVDELEDLRALPQLASGIVKPSESEEMS